jgi:pyruvate dehydrogenase E1 component
MPSDLGDTIGDEYLQQLVDSDPVETREWQESLDAVIEEHGPTRARYLLAKLLERAHEQRLGVPGPVTTPYVNTIPVEDQPEFPGDAHLERRIRRFIRWNAAVMVVKANHRERDRRAPLHLRLVSDALRSRLQPLL